MRSKSPSFNFFPDDFLAGVLHLTCEERGAYITLLCVQHGHGHLSTEIIKRLIGADVFERVWPMISSKFIQDDDKNYFNQRLENEIAAKVKHSETQSENGKKGGRPRKEKKPIKSETKAKQKPPNGIGIGNGNTKVSDPKTEQSISINGGGRGEIIPASNPDYAMGVEQFIATYDYGTRAKTERELADAVESLCRDGTCENQLIALQLLIDQAAKSRLFDIRNGGHRQKAENWLRDKQYRDDWGKRLEDFSNTQNPQDRKKGFLNEVEKRYIENGL